jgi:glycosyltransferase involved in cell wall biosynthesis
VKQQILQLYPASKNKKMNVLFHPLFFTDHAHKNKVQIPHKHHFKLLFLGRLLPYKGLDILIDAYVLLKAKKAPISLTLAGSGTLDADVHTRIERLGITLHQKWLSDDEIIALIKDHECVVLPYREASQSGVIAAAHGLLKPVVTTPVGGLPEQVHAPIGGRIAIDMTPDALCDAMCTVMHDLHNNPDFYDTLHGYAKTQTWDIFIKRLNASTVN